MILRFLMLMWWASTASNDATGPSGPSGGSVTFVGSPTPGSSSAQSTSNQARMFFHNHFHKASNAFNSRKLELSFCVSACKIL
eukprot:UN09730